MESERIYRDRVYGCWLGKCIGGNIGAPYEGMKQRMHLQYSPKFLENMLPNDDLDLQILWLDVLERKGKNATVADYAHAFNENCDYAPGEYAFFKKNYRKGIMPPLSGSFNNEYFNEGMGAPIRSELWACLFPENGAAAAEYARRDASADHREDGESAQGEVFLAVLESLAFGGGEIHALIRAALAYLPKHSRLKHAISDVLRWYGGGLDMDATVDRIIRDYGHSESAMVHQNISIIVAALLHGGGSFIDSVMLAVNCGFDTDCTGATVGAAIGILQGGAEISRICGVKDAEYKLGIRSPRTDCRVSVLAREVADLALRFKAQPEAQEGITVVQESTPTIGFGERHELVLRIRAGWHIDKATVTLKIAPPAVLERESFIVKFALEAVIKKFAYIPEGVTSLPEGMPGEVMLNGEVIGRFGLSAKRRWQVYGPFWKNNVQIPPLEAGESYWKYIPSAGDEFMDTLRFFHISSLPDEKVDVAALLAGKGEERHHTEFVDTDEDVIRLGHCTGFQGNSAYLFRTWFEVEEERTVGLQIGRNTPVRVWLNGELLAERDGNEMFYHETIHKLCVRLKKGINGLAFWIVKNNEDTRFSYEFLAEGVCSDHLMFSIVDPVAKTIEREESEG